jgi:hypothetical protein
MSECDRGNLKDGAFAVLAEPSAECTVSLRLSTRHARGSKMKLTTKKTTATRTAIGSVD